MTTILVIYHSQSGNTKKMAESVSKGINTVVTHVQKKIYSSKGFIHC